MSTKPHKQQPRFSPLETTSSFVLEKVQLDEEKGLFKENSPELGG